MQRLVLGVGFLVLAATVMRAEPARTAPPVERGKEALLGRSYAPAVVPQRSYDALWRTWGLKEKPADFDRAVLERYGLHPAPYPNAELPMGLRPATHLLFGKGVGTDCMLCHAGSILGQSYIGLGNNTLDLQTLFDDFAVALGLKQMTPFPISNVRGTTEASASAGYLFAFRNPDLTLRSEPLKIEYRTDTCEDVPAWWLL